VLPFESPIKYEILRTALIWSAVMFRLVCEFMKTIEEIHPLPTHPSYFDEWYTDIYDFWITTGEECPKELYTVLALRKRIYDASFDVGIKTPSTDAWKWLLTVDQMPQRTEEWYTQKRNMVTASEISNLWKGPRSRISLIAAKSGPPKESPTKSLAVLRESTSAMDWGVRYEPVVKAILEREPNTKIQELGRIQHRTVQGLAASPDGLYVESADKCGFLIEIKCPTTRVIDSKIPFEYWCQMQIQMEVCDIDMCEYVEAKFAEGASASASAPASAEATGFISLFVSESTDEMKYVYHAEPVVTDASSWLCIETYSWTCTSMRRTMVARDRAWFEKMQPDIDLFWKEVADVREGRRVLEPPKKKALPVPQEDTQVYSFVDD